MMGREVTATAGTGSKSHPNIAIQGTHRQNGDFFDSINPIATKSRTSRHFRFGSMNETARAVERCAQGGSGWRDRGNGTGRPV